MHKQTGQIRLTINEKTNRNEIGPMVLVSSEMLGVLFPSDASCSLVAEPPKLAKKLPFLLEPVESRLALRSTDFISMVFKQMLGYLIIISF